jgi:hypothetical protein
VEFGEHAARAAALVTAPKVNSGINSSALLPAAEVPTAILRGLSTHRAADAEDDAIVVCLDWYGGAGE